MNTVVESYGVAGTPAGGVHSVQGVADGTPVAVSDAARVNTELVVLASAARTTTRTQANQVNLYHRGIRVTIDVTDIGTGSITPEIDALDAASGAYIPILTGAAITGNGTAVLLVYPSTMPVANLAASDVLPVGWRIVVTAADANPVTYSVGAVLLV
jgi:hypothetical protein